MARTDATTANQSKGEKAGGRKTILFSFTVKVHVNVQYCMPAFFTTSSYLKKNLHFSKCYTGKRETRGHGTTAL